jgi:hypothetical protein
MSQIIAMARRLQEAEETIAELKSAIAARPPQPQNVGASVDPTDIPVVGERSRGYALPSSSLDIRHNFDRPPGRSPSKEPLSEELLSDLSLDEHGKASIPGHSLSSALNTRLTILRADILPRADVGHP